MNTLGVATEQRARLYLQSKGLTFLEANYRCRYGEIDLILKDKSTLVFVEVRYRANQDFGGAAASITSQKQQKILRTAQYYLQEHGDQACRFDVVAFGGNAAEKMEWISNAFEA